jgi:Mrp family chromosome partitioning ATPase
MFGIKGEVTGCEDGIIPLGTKTGIDAISINMLLNDDTAPVIWRGPVIAGTVKQFWTETIWNDIDYMFIDCPPGTGDVPLTVFQSIPLDGIIIVSTPQDLVSMIVSKAAHMAQMMNIPVYGLIENMSYVKCPDCGKEIKIFGDGHIDEVAEKFGYDVMARVPIDPKLTALVDKGWIEIMENDYLDAAAQMIINRGKSAE